MTKGGKKVKKSAPKMRRARAPVKVHVKQRAGMPGPNSMRPRRTLGLDGVGGTVMGGVARNSMKRVRPGFIDEDELIGIVNGSVAFATTSYSCNPGQVTTFPWGNKIAQLYEEYDFESLEFYYTATVTGYATEGQTGTVVLSFDYDASDVAPTTQQQVENTVPHTVPALPSNPMAILTIDCNRIRKNVAKYVRPGALPAGADIKTYDAGNLYVSTNGCTGASQCGELHVRYKCRLIEPILEASSLAGGVVHFTSIAPTSADNFAGSQQQPGGSSQLQPITVGSNTITFPAAIPGNYLITMMVAGSTSATALSFASSTGVGSLKLFAKTGVVDNSSFTASLAGTTTAAAMYAYAVTLSAAGGTIVFTPSTLVGGNAMDLFITSLPVTVLTQEQRERKRAVADARLRARLSRLEKMLAMADVSDDEADEDELLDIEECHLGVSASAPPPRRLSSTAAEQGLAAALKGAIRRPSHLKIVMEE